MSKAPDVVGDLMTTDVVSVSPEGSVRDAVKAMLDHDIGSVIVVDDDEAVGVFTERDLTRRVEEEGLLDRQVADVMTSPVVSAGPGDEIVFVFERMVEAGIRRLPVVEDGKVVGVVTERDLMRWVGEVAQE